jgi:hypothetical protein
MILKHGDDIEMDLSKTDCSHVKHAELECLRIEFSIDLLHQGMLNVWILISRT